jgi:hypothetical protein
MWKYSSWLFFLLFIGLVNISKGQDYVDLFRVQYSNTGINEFKNDTSGFKNAGSGVQEFGVDLTLPIKLNDKFVIISGYSYDNLELYTFPQQLTGPSSTYKMHSAKLGLSWQHNDTWSGQYLLIPKTTGSLDDINNKNSQVAALALIKQKKKENLFLRYGAYHNSEIFGPFFVPLLGIWYRSPNKKFEMNWTLPVWADMNYTWKPWLTTGFNFQSFVRTFYAPQYFSNFKGGKLTDQYMVKASNEIFLYTQFNIKRSFLIQTKVGQSIGRKFKHYNYGDNVDWGFSAFRFGDNRTQLNPNLKDGLIFQVRLIYRFWLDDEAGSEPTAFNFNPVR